MQPFDYIIPQDHAEASALLAAGNGASRPLQGGTDLLIRARGGFVKPQQVVDLKALPGMREIRPGHDGWLVIGAACTMNQVAAHPLVQAGYDLLVQACNSVASYQLRNRATVGGNCCNASPAADTAPALYCLDAVAETFGPAGARRIPIAQFFTDPGKTALQRGEFLTGIHLPPAPANARGVFNKLGRTKVGDISMVSVAVWVDCRSQIANRKSDEGQALHNTQYAIRAVRIALGAVGPTPLRAPEAEAALTEDASPAGIRRAAQLAAAAARPIDDIRASAAYRRAMVEVLTRRGIETLLQQVGAPPLLPDFGGNLMPPQSWGDGGAGRRCMNHAIAFTVNGERYTRNVPSHHTLLQVLREQLALTGTKNGCEAGECGACAVLMRWPGANRFEPVNSCMVLAPEAAGAEIITIEGLMHDDQLDPLQEAFLATGATQCGFCTSGILVNARALLYRNPDPAEAEIREALVGNLCRCTGYVRIIDAVKLAARAGKEAAR